MRYLNDMAGNVEENWTVFPADAQKVMGWTQLCQTARVSDHCHDEPHNSKTATWWKPAVSEDCTQKPRQGRLCW
jgi:hypothetical protein